MNKNYEPIDEETEAIASKAIEAAFRVHRELAPGLLESVYELCFCYELKQLGLKYERQKPVDINYKGQTFHNTFRADVIVEKEIIFEIKSVEKVHPLYEAQLLTYLKLTGYRLGFIVNFNVPKLKDGIFRRVF